MQRKAQARLYLIQTRRSYDELLKYSQSVANGTPCSCVQSLLLWPLDTTRGFHFRHSFLDGDDHHGGLAQTPAHRSVTSAPGMPRAFLSRRRCKIPPSAHSLKNGARLRDEMSLPSLPRPIRVRLTAERSFAMQRWRVGGHDDGWLASRMHFPSAFQPLLLLTPLLQ